MSIMNFGSIIMRRSTCSKAEIAISVDAKYKRILMDKRKQKKNK